MFTGLVAEKGKIISIVRKGSIWKMRISSKSLISSLRTGDSISVNGACLTVVGRDSRSFWVEVTEETLKRTNFNQLRCGSIVNLEPPLRAGDPVGGHFVTGHIDGTGKVAKVEKKKGVMTLWVQVPPEIKNFMVEKGSVSLNGVSLTISQVMDDRIKVILIPHTLRVTNLSQLRPGDMVNVEADLLLKGLEKIRGGEKNE